MLRLPCLMLIAVACVYADGWQTDGPPVDPAAGTPPAGLGGWFFNPDPQQPFPAPGDPSQQWTSAENIALMNYWLSLVAQYSNDPVMEAQLRAVAQPGWIAQASGPGGQLNLAETQGVTPEPATLWLFGGAVGYLALRRRPGRDNGGHVPLRRPC